jgi:hypothetical protein
MNTSRANTNSTDARGGVVVSMLSAGVCVVASKALKAVKAKGCESPAMIVLCG